LVTFNGTAQENLSLPLPKYYKENKLNSLNAYKPFSQSPLKLKEKQNNLNIIKPYFHKKSPFLFSDPDTTKNYEVITLKQDGMPCIVPNMRKLNTMPNVSKPADLSRIIRKPGAMPNPYFKQQVPKNRPFIKPDSPKKEGS
jgi:hypothetical protein